MTKNLERVLRPIVEGQVTGFVKEHPGVLDCVIWYKPSKDRTDAFVGSISKRIIQDLMSDENVGRLRAALLADGSGSVASSDVASKSAPESGDTGKPSGVTAHQPQIGKGTHE